MKIDLNKDFEQAFPDEAFGGFTPKQCLVAVVGLCISFGCAVCLWQFLGIGIVEATYISLPLLIPICFPVFYRYQGQTPFHMASEIRFHRQTKELCYEAGEMPEGVQRLIHFVKQDDKRAKRRKRQKRQRR